jgi:hypothetical protein
MDNLLELKVYVRGTRDLVQVVHFGDSKIEDCIDFMQTAGKDFDLSLMPKEHTHL